MSKNISLTTDEPTGKDYTFYVRIPEAIAFRLDRQIKRLSCSRSMFTRMAMIKLLEEEESKEQR